MSIVRFVHAADLHLDSPFHGLHNADPGVAERLREATFQAYERIIDLCLERQVDALLLAGDIYDSADRSLAAQLRFVEGLKRLDEAGIRSFVCHGNHDPLDGWTASLQLPPTCHQFSPEVGAVPMTADGRATVYGMSYPSAAVSEDVTSRFVRRVGDGYAVGLLHTNVGNQSGHANYAPSTMEGLAGTGMNYWALGHVHTARILQERHPAIVYPGNPQGLNPNETGPRGVYYVEVGDDYEARLEFVPVSPVRWEQADVSIEGIEQEQDLIDRLAAVARDMLESTNHSDTIYRIRLVGRGPLHTAVIRDGMLRDLQSHLNTAMNAPPPLLWCGQITAATGPVFNREERIQADDYLADVLQIIDQARSDPDARAALREHLEPLYGHTRLRRYLEHIELSDEDLDEVLTAAEGRIVTALLDES